MRASTRCFNFGVVLLAVANGLFSAGAWAQDDPPEIKPEQIEAGRQLYAQHCAVCHGPKMVEAGGGFFDLRTFPPQQRRRFFTSVGNGKNSMPPWRTVLNQEQIGSLFAYVVAGEKK
jgi:mono/diheme cytochrome c family protein